MADKILFGRAYAAQRILDIITKYGLMAATNGFISPPPPPVKVRMATKDAKSVLLSLPRKMTFTVELGPPHFAEQLPPRQVVCLVDATCKSLGAGVQEMTFTASETWDEVPPTEDSESSPEA